MSFPASLRVYSDLLCAISLLGENFNKKNENVDESESKISIPFPPPYPIHLINFLWNVNFKNCFSLLLEIIEIDNSMNVLSNWLSKQN